MSVRKRSTFDNTAYGKCVIDSTIPASIIWKLQWKIKSNQDFAVGIASVPSNPPATNICFAFDECNDNIKWYSFRNHHCQTTFECHDMQWNLQCSNNIDGNNDGSFWKNDDILVLILKLTEISEKSTLSFGRERNGKVQWKEQVFDNILIESNTKYRLTLCIPEGIRDNTGEISCNIIQYSEQHT
eukprot:133734_1